MMVTSPRLAAKACSSAGTNTGKLSPSERLATPSTKQSATSIHGTKRAIVHSLRTLRALRQPEPCCSFRAAERVPVDTITIAPGFNGPRLSGNGGYVAGVLAERYTRAFGGDGAVEITLRAPIPIARALEVVPEGEALILRDGDTLLCEARAGSVDHLKPPPAPTDWAEVMRRGEDGGTPPDSEFGTCLVCAR